MKAEVIHHCQEVLPSWRGLSIDDFDVEEPKGFSSFTMGVHVRNKGVQPAAVLYRKLKDKENAILDFEAEKEVFQLLGKNKIAASVYRYENDYRIEEFYKGRTLQTEDLFQPHILKGIAEQLYRFHQLQPRNLPKESFFELLHKKWGEQARVVLEEKWEVFPANEQEMCKELREIYSEETFAKVKQALPNSPLTFCHNDTYHGNTMLLENGDIKLFDFEFSCLNHKAFDFANLFAETVMKHKLPKYPYFRIAEPEFSTHEIGLLIGFYLAHESFSSEQKRKQEYQRLVKETQAMLMFSDYMYAMAALPLAIEPIQKIRFIPYSLARFQKFLAAYHESFGE